MTTENNTSENIDSKRRGFTKLGVTAPVLMTLASKPVLGANCLSDAMSGNLSDHARESCEPGFSPGGWKTIGGEPEWGPTGYVYGVYDEKAKYTKSNETTATEECDANKKNEFECYVGGSTLGDTALGSLFPPSYGGESLVKLLWEFNGAAASPPLGHYISAYLNARYTGINYALTVQQVLDMISGTIPVPPGFSSVADYFDSTWNYRP